jgi:hypothetical protein
MISCFKILVVDYGFVLSDNDTKLTLTKDLDVSKLGII